MVCEHPTCTLEGTTICKYHCHLSVCQQHRIEHEKELLNEFEKQLDNLSKPISCLLNQFHSDLKQSEECRQREIDQINSSFDPHLIFTEQNSKLLKTTNDLLSQKREQLINYQTGDNQLTKDDYQQVENLSQKIQQNLQQQSQLNNQIRDKNHHVNSWSIDTKPIINNRSTEIECIELSDSEEDQSQYSMDTSETESKSRPSKKFHKKDDVILIRACCPLTEYGVFGLNHSHNVRRLCSKVDSRERCLYAHLGHFHRLKSSIANKIVKAVRNGDDPMNKIIFPQDNTPVIEENLPCPFDSNAEKFNRKNSIPNTPCSASLNYHYFRNHLHQVHSITKLNSSLILKAMRKEGTISHVQFEEDLCETY